jgi:hypothetical protein
MMIKLLNFSEKEKDYFTSLTQQNRSKKKLVETCREDKISKKVSSFQYRFIITVFSVNESKQRLCNNRVHWGLDIQQKRGSRYRNKHRPVRIPRPKAVKNSKIAFSQLLSNSVLLSWSKSVTQTVDREFL